MNKKIIQNKVNVEECLTSIIQNKKDQKIKTWIPKLHDILINNSITLCSVYEKKESYSSVLILEIIIEMSNCARFFRNICTTKENQEYIRQINLIKIILSLIINCSEWIHTKIDTEQIKELNVLCCILVQICCNFTVQNVENQFILWQNAFPHAFLEVFIHLKTNRKLIGYMALTLNNCIVGENNDFLNQLISNKDLLSSVILGITPTTQSTQDMMDKHKYDEAFDSIMILFNNIFTKKGNMNTFNRIYQLFSSDKLYQISTEELLLLNILHYLFIIEKCIPIENLYHFNNEIVDLLANIYIKYVNLQSVDDNIHVENDLIMKCLIFQAKRCILDIFGECSCNVINNSIAFLLNNKGILYVSLYELSLTKRQRNVHNNGIPIGYNGCLIRLIGNLCYNNTKNQDLMRIDIKNKNDNTVKTNGILMLLNSCEIHPNEPFIREWSIVALRNICENNLKNQLYIKEMKQQLKAHCHLI